MQIVSSVRCNPVCGFKAAAYSYESSLRRVVELQLMVHGASTG
jgi:hypothetical protein